MASAQPLPHVNVALVPIRLQITKALTSAATTADVAKVVVPYACRVHKVTPVHGTSGGGTPFTDLDVDVENGTTDIVTAMALVDSSADVNTAVGPETAALGVLAAGDVLHLDAVTTGGSSPSLVGYGVDLWVSRI